ncbi:TetR/AcrR family transcriptional regulator [Desulfosarcina cetonica]|uniref:TetR/AcrR family transcriptional regulator n=1 Tax=Desulfosarcina cetonica TaxID=90730 RepID=UPI001FED9A57|nr:TetR/AcrR family transcriptional regulator [Desulfosarcina cetonica]
MLAANRRKDLLKAAQEIFSQKGLVDSNISDIARKANIADSIIYHYFINKEDLLFYALADKLDEVEKELKLHLEGIRDPVSKLGKMIWYHLYINDLSPQETRVLKDLLFECRSNQNFYSHEGYQALRRYTKIMSDILQQGINEKVFRSDINIVLVRNMIFGLLDEESLSRFSSQEIDSTLPDFNDIMDLVLAILSCEEAVIKETANDNNKEARILKAAVQVFSEKGYNAATMAEIASAANVAEGTIYIYYQSKSDLLFSIPKRRFKWLRDSRDEVFHIDCPIKKLRRFIRLLFTTFMGNRDFLRVFLLDIKLNKKFYISPVYKDYIDYVSILEKILEEGKARGLFKSNINNRLFRNLFLGAFTHLAMRWVILDKAKPIDMMQSIEDLVSLLSWAVVVDKAALQEIEESVG